MLLAVGGPAVGQTPTQETVAFVADLERVPPCCDIPMELAALLALAEFPGIIRVVMDEATGLLVVTFDPTRVSRGQIIGALERYGFRVDPIAVAVTAIF